MGEGLFSKVVGQQKRSATLSSTAQHSTCTRSLREVLLRDSKIVVCDDSDAVSRPGQGHWQHPANPTEQAGDAAYSRGMHAAFQGQIHSACNLLCFSDRRKTPTRTSTPYDAHPQAAGEEGLCMVRRLPVCRRSEPGHKVAAMSPAIQEEMHRAPKRTDRQWCTAKPLLRCPRHARPWNHCWSCISTTVMAMLTIQHARSNLWSPPRTQSARQRVGRSISALQAGCPGTCMLPPRGSPAHRRALNAAPRAARRWRQHHCPCLCRHPPSAP